MGKFTSWARERGQLKPAIRKSLFRKNSLANVPPVVEFVIENDTRKQVAQACPCFVPRIGENVELYSEAIHENRMFVVKDIEYRYCEGQSIPAPSRVSIKLVPLQDLLVVPTSTE
jgi:hypothetical protein